jgi:hypothetical protein
MNTPTPTPGFEFPSDARDLIEKQLRASFDERQPLKSVRPSRQPQVVTPVEVRQEELQPQRNTVPVRSGATTPIADPEGISIDLPSRFFYYTFKDLYVRPFKLSHLAKVAKAHETSSMQTLAEVVSSVLSTPNGDTNIAFQLNMADFNAVLYWLRLNSFSKKQMRLTHQCTDPNHLAQVEAGTKTQESLKVTTIYTNSDLKMRHLDEAPDPEKYSIMVPGYDQKVQMRPETVSDVVQFLDHPDWEDPEFQYKARVASVIGLGISLEQRIALIDDLDPDQALLALAFADLVDTYGVDELVSTNCMECGASTAVKTAVDALTFLSPEF